MAETDERTLVGMQASMARFVAAARSAPAACGAAAKPRAPARKPYGLGSQAIPGARSAPAAQGPAPAAGGAAAEAGPERRPSGLVSQVPSLAHSAPGAQGSQGARHGEAPLNPENHTNPKSTCQAGAPETPTKRRPREEDGQAGACFAAAAEARAGSGAHAEPGPGAGSGSPDLGSPAKRRCSPASSPVAARSGGGGGGGAWWGARANLGASPPGRGRPRRSVVAAAAARAPGRRLVQQRLQLGPLTPASREARAEEGGPAGDGAPSLQAVQTPSAAAGDPGRSGALGEPAGGGADVVDLCTPSTGERDAGSPVGLRSGPAPRSGGSIVDLTQDDDS